MLPDEAVFSVSELNRYASALLSADPNLNRLTVTGEISGFKRHTTGHLYFTLKDENASVRAVMFKFNAMRLTFLPKDGMSVKIKGRVGLYERDGSFQIYAETMQKTGEGDLYRKFLLYKAELEQKGWFDASVKKPIPAFPHAVGVVTSSSGAAIEDIRNVIGRRFPGMPIRLYTASVQGAGAAEEIAAAIRTADAEKTCDVLIVGRGGGSLEDLWAFNEPPVAKAIHDCSLPVISAVGHEIDFSISDFVADLRAPTPSAAAELAVPEFSKLKQRLLEVRTRLQRSVGAGLQEKKTALKLLGQSRGLQLPLRALEQSRERVDADREKLDGECAAAIRELRSRLQLHYAVLRSYSPEGLVKRGYTLITDGSGNRIAKAEGILPGDALHIRFIDGTVSAKALEVDLDNNN